MASSSQSTASTGNTTPAPSANSVVRPGWPITTFKVEGVPEITMAGTVLTADQLKKAEAAAEAQNFNLEVDNSGKDK